MKYLSLHWSPWLRHSEAPQLCAHTLLDYLSLQCGPSCRKGDATGYFPSMYLQKAGEEITQAQRQIRVRGAPPRR